jgi:hypothetical protein
VLSCYLSAPVGTKDGADYDWIYNEIVRPAVEQAGLECRRADEFGAAAHIQKAILQAVIASDVLIADVSNQNPNVMYELGIRHALRRGATILMSSVSLPFNVSHCFALHYEVQGDGTVAPAQVPQIRQVLTSAIRERIERVVNDSPVFEFFPAMRVDLSEEVELPGVRRYTRPPRLDMRQRTGKEDRKSDVARAEEVTRAAANVDPQEYLAVLKRYRNLSAWTDVIRYAESLPPDVAASPQVVQIVAHALMRLNHHDRAIELLNRDITETGGDAETYGLLGSIYKRRYNADGSVDDLRRAIANYRTGYERFDHDLYLGSNLALLLQREGSEQGLEYLARKMPRLRAFASEKLKSATVPDYWDLETALLLSLVDRDWSSAADLAERLRAAAPEGWMLDGTREELSGMLTTAQDDSDRQQLTELIGQLRDAATARQEEEGDAYL